MGHFFATAFPYSFSGLIVQDGHIANQFDQFAYDFYHSTILIDQENPIGTPLDKLRKEGFIGLSETVPLYAGLALTLHNIAASKKDIEHAVPFLATALRVYPDAFYAHAGLFFAMFRQQKESLSSSGSLLPHLNKLRQIRPGHYQTHLAMSAYHALSGNDQRAKDCLVSAFHLFQKAGRMFEGGGFDMSYGDYNGQFIQRALWICEIIDKEASVSNLRHLIKTMLGWPVHS